MSTLSGNATKGEKGKKFQQLKILLPSGSKSAEPEQQPNKSSAQRIQHGMTSLGKVPTARRPTNLPSEKSEQSGNDPSVNLVPSGGPGWGNKANETGPTTTPSLVQNANPPASVPVNSTPMPGTSQPAQHVQHYPPASRMPPMPSQVGHVPVHHGHPDAKTWARMTLGGDSSAANPFTPQSPLFHTEFPSLSSNAEASTASTTHATATVAQKPTINTVADTQYGPGPSLRPQTVSWMSGSRPQGTMGPQAGNPIASVPAQVRPAYPAHIGPDGVRSNLAPSGVGVVPAGPYHPSVMSDKIPQYGALMPPFMLRNSYPGGFPPPGVGPRPPYGPPYMPGQHAPAERFMQPPNSGANSAKRPYDDEDTKIRSIIKEEDLNQMANIGNDIGWAGQEDIDYNQKLKFSDDEDDDKNKENRSGKSRSKLQASKLAADKPAPKKDSDKENEFRTSMESLKEREKMFPAAENRPLEMRNVWQARKTMVAANATTRYQITAAPGPGGPGRFGVGEDDDELQERRKQKKDEMEIIIQRARERKEEVEKQYQQQLQQAAHMKLKQLDERIMAEQQRKMEIKDPHYTDREMDMLPEWEKEKLRAQNRLNEGQAAEDAKKSQTATPVPVVKDASEFRALTQLGDRSAFVKKEKEPSNAAQSANYSRSFSNNVPPRFQNLNRQISSNSGANSAAAPLQGPSDPRKNSLSQFSNKSNSPNEFGSVRHRRLDSDSMSDKEDTRKERYLPDDRLSERYQRDNVHSRDYNYDRDDEPRKFESDSKKKFYEKGDYTADSGRDFDREANYGGKFERKNSESDRSDKSKDYASRRYSETESHDKEPVMSWRHEESPEKSRHFNAPPRSPRTFSETEHRERKKSREEGNYEKLSFNVADKERDYYRKELSSRDRHMESARDKEHDHRRDSLDYKSIENDVKREREIDKKEKDSYKDNERKSPATYDDRLRESRYSRESRETLRDESRYTIQEERAYSWADEGDVEEKPVLRRDHHYREERGDRYSHAQRHPPGPITREKLEAKELEDSKRNLTALVRSDKKTEIKKSEPEEKKEKEKQEITAKPEKISESSSRSQKREEPVKSAWHKEDKKEKDEAKSAASSNDAGADKKDNRDKEDTKESSKSASSKQSIDESGSTTKGTSGGAGGTDEKRDRERRDDRKKSDRLPKRDSRGSNWPRHAVYRGGNPYAGGRTEQKLHRSSRTSGSSGKNSSRRDSKYSESDYSDEISGSGREDRQPRNDRDERSVKSKRYDREDRNMDYRSDNRDYMGGNRGGGRNRDYYYKPSHRGRGGFRASTGVSKRMDGYGPPPSKSPFSNSSSYGDERRHKSKDIDSHGHEQSSDKKDSTHFDKGNVDGKHSSGSNSRQQNDSDKNSKKNEVVQDVKSTVSSPTSVQTAEANEESFATASEGTDSEDNGQIVKSKPTFSGTKRPATVVVTKPQSANYRSNSRKRFEGRRTAPLYSRKDSGSYGTGKRNSTNSGGGKSSGGGNKENDKYAAEAVTDGVFGKSEQESKSTSNEKTRREYSDNQASSTAAKKSVKSRNRSNSRKNVRSSGVPNSRSKNQDLPARMPTKQRKSYDTKLSSDYKESKLDIPMPLFKELGPPIPAPPPATNAWDKPITGALRTGSPSTSVSAAAAAANAAAVAAAANSASLSANASHSGGMSNVGHDKVSMQVIDQHVDSTRSDLGGVGGGSGLGADKMTPKVLENLDGSTPPVQTIIFENTNFKSAPGDKTKYSNQLKNHRYDKDMNLNANDCSGMSNFSTDPSNSELPSKHNPLMALSFHKNEDVSDMKLDFAFDSEFSKLTDDNKSAAKSMELHAMQLGQSTDAELNRKIAQVKKVWDGSLMESYDDKYDGVMVNTSSTSFSPSFSSHGSDPNTACFVNAHVEGAEHLQVDDVGMVHNEVVFSPVSQIQGVNASYGSVTNCQTVVIKNDSTSSSSNVCKVKPQPQGCSTNMAANVAAQSTVMSATLVSQPPPMSSPSYTFSCSTPQPSLNSNAVAATALAQINFQAAAAQYGSMPPVPSSPVLYNSTQPAAPGPTALYGAFQIENPQVAARTQFNQFAAAATYGLSGAVGQTSAFNQSVFVQQPPPSAPPPEMYPPYRLQPQAFGNTQQITSPSTVLISSTSNSLMSATIKPTNQPISAIGTKTGYPTAQSSQLYIPLDPATQLLNQNFMPGSQLPQRLTSNVIPAASLQAASTSFYTTGSGAGQTGYFPTGTNSPLQPQPGTAIGLSPYSTQSAAPSLGPTAMQNFGSQLTQQFRSAPSYLKNSANACSIGSDFGNGKPITLPNQHDLTTSVFPPGTQMSSTKPRIPTGGKNVVQNVQQAMGQHTMSQNSYSYQSANQMRNNGGANKGSQYPHPIQRPVSQGNANSSNRAGNSTGNTSSHRMPVRNNAHQLVNNIQQQPPSSVYYTSSSGYSNSSAKLEASSLDSKSESNSDSKLADSIKTINSKNTNVSSSEKTAVTNE